MAKDPAVLFYTSDFLTGTMTMTNEQVGKYVRLLCLQHQKTHLTEKDMLYVCGTYDEEIFSKFTKVDSFYFNERLRKEADKRNRFCESRRVSRTSHIRKSYVPRMEDEDEDVNEDRNKDEDVKVKRVAFKPPTIEEVRVYCKERKNNIDPIQFHAHYEANGWKQKGGNLIKKWQAAVITWEKNGFNQQVAKPSSQLQGAPTYAPVSEEDRAKLSKLISETAKQLKSTK